MVIPSRHYFLHNYFAANVCEFFQNINLPNLRLFNNKVLFLEKFLMTINLKKSHQKYL